MAYDPNDANDKKIVDKMIKDAVDAAMASATEEHEADIQGLKDKNKELIEKLRKARTGDNAADAGEIERLETELASNQGELRKAQQALRAAERAATEAATARDAAVSERDTEASYSRNLLIQNGLTAALLENKVAEHHLPAVTALLNQGLEVKAGTDGKRQVFAGDKPLSEHVKEWAASEAGKHYVSAPANGGGNAGGGSQGGGTGAKKISEMSEVERNTHYNAIGREAFDAQVAAEKANK